MTTLNPEATRPTSAYLTPDTPERGEIRVGNIVLSAVDHWQEDGLHVFRSAEYDVIAAHESLDVAVRQFIDKSEDYAQFLSEGDPPVEDLRLALIILSRLVDGYESVAERDLYRRRIIRMLRGRGHNASRGWYHRPAARI